MSAEEQAQFLQRLAEDLNSRKISLPSFPDVVIKIRNALEDPTCSSARLATVARLDPVLVSPLLIAANSAFHNRAGIEIMDLNLAISRLGFEVVRNTAITLAIEQIFKVDGVEILRFLAKKKSKASILLASGMDLKTLSTAEYLGRSFGLNMCGVLQKPIVLETLRSALRTTLKQQHVSVESLRQAISNGVLQVHYQPIASQNTAGGWTVSVNLSPLLLANRDFPDYLDKLLAHYRADNSDFILELTEGEATRDTELTMDVLTRLRLKGIGLSIDDFGTGYSSLKQLFLLPFSELKLDLSFVSRMHDNAEAEKMVKIMIYLAHELGMTSCAEGVETMATLRLLESYGCDKIQGYLISKAVPGEDFLKVSQDWDSRENFPHSVTV